MSRPPLSKNASLNNGYNSLFMQPAKKKYASAMPPKMPATPVNLYVPKCQKSLGEGAHGSAEKQCFDDACTNCRVIKTSLYNDKDSFLREAALDDALQIAVIGTPYEKLVPKFYMYEDRGTQQVIETSWNPNVGNMEAYLKKHAHTMTPQTFARLLAQIFSTLAFLHEKIGFRHMDLKCDNVLIVNNNEPFVFASVGPQIIDSLPITAEVDGEYKNINLNLPYSNVSAMIIDFGNSDVKKGLTYRGIPVQEEDIYIKGSVFDGQCNFQAFDVFRMIADIYNIFKNFRAKPTFYPILEKLKTTIFGDFFDKTFNNSKSYIEDFRMLNSTGCRQLKSYMSLHGVITYASVAKIIADIPEGGITTSRFVFGRRKDNNNNSKSMSPNGPGGKENSISSRRSRSSARSARSSARRPLKSRASPAKSYLQRSLQKLRSLFKSYYKRE